MIAFQIPGEPVAFARSGGKGAVRFTPKKQRDFMALVQLAASKAMDGQEPLDGPVEMIIRATYLIPTSWSKKKAAAAKWRTSKPDADNLAKIVSDGINTIVFADDAQVASLIVQKTYGPLAGMTVSVQRLADHVEGANG
jgi:Holliday junction resolvase RusA-like endonuclease